MLKVMIGTARRTEQGARSGAPRSLTIRAIGRYFVAAIGASVAFSGAAMADIGPGLYRAVGGAGLERDVCWQRQLLHDGRWVNVERYPRKSGADLISEAQSFSKTQNFNRVYTGSEGDPNVVFVRDQTINGRLIRRYIAVPCPPPAPATSAPLPTVSRLQVNTFVFPVFGPQPGAVIGLQIIKVTGDGHFVERFVSTDQITNTFDPRKDPVGAGLLLGYGFNLANNIGLMPFVSVDFPNISVKQTFANGSFLGTTSGVSATAGVKVGPQFNDVWLYGIVGVSALGEALKVNFLPVASSTDTIVPGATVGAGVAYRLPNFSKVSLFAEYQHTWWREGKFNTPLASPLFAYTFGRQDDVVKVGFTVSLSSPSSPASAPGYPVKASPK
jgi:hypothetical protein